jgi:hypothetical protein
MKESIKDDLTEQALDIFFNNQILYTKILEPIKRRVIPIIICIALFNLILFVMIVYLTRRLSKIL